MSNNTSNTQQQGGGSTRKTALKWWNSLEYKDQVLLWAKYPYLIVNWNGKTAKDLTNREKEILWDVEINSNDPIKSEQPTPTPKEQTEDDEIDELEKQLWNEPTGAPTSKPKDLSTMSTEELQWRVDNPEGAKWFDAFKSSNQLFIELAKGAAKLKDKVEKYEKENTQLKDKAKELRHEINNLKFALSPLANLDLEGANTSLAGNVVYQRNATYITVGDVERAKELFNK